MDGITGETLSDRQKYDFKRSLEEIRNLKGRGTELISVYVPPTKQISDVAAYLREEFSQSSNIKSASTRKNVQGAISSILARLKYFKTPPANGVIFFVGEISATGDQTRMVQYVLEPPDPITTFLYRCDSDFYLEPLEGMLLDKKVYGLVVIDRSEATVGVLRGKAIHVIRNLDSLVPSKHRMGGQSAQRFERLIEISANEYYKKVSDIMTESFLGIDGLQGILVGGPGPSKEFFIKEGYLHHELAKKVVDTFDIGYTDEYGLKELVEKAKDKLYDLDLMREKRLFQQFLNEIRKSEGGLSVYGEDQIRNAIMIGAVDVLLVSEGIRKRRVTLDCPQCGTLELTIDKSPEGTVMTCPKCGTVGTVTKDVDLVDDLFDQAGMMGTKVELISPDSEEGEMLLKAFGGIAGLLRFSIGG
ncbi:MAG TPA: peptide chain release factor aRF-1 [Methanomassiliicoccales archaeon]|nr:peptide chain release factor aRF-1 [Methanomassiliicoccales archaeon]HPR97712.1 peptide chain release factor aRF-1 [Methanomassiliicoccales archaeon]